MDKIRIILLLSLVIHARSHAMNAQQQDLSNVLKAALAILRRHCSDDHLPRTEPTQASATFPEYTRQETDSTQAEANNEYTKRPHE